MEDNIERIRPKRTAPKIIAAVIIFLALIVINSAYVVTEENEYTLIKQFGEVVKIIDEPGLNIKIPFIQTSDTLPKSIQIYDLAASDVITEDKKTMVVDSYVLWRIVDPKLFVQSLNSQLSNGEARINTTVYNSTKAVISSLEQSEVISGRDGVLSQKFLDNIGDTMSQYGIELLAVETKHLDLPSDNKASVYERMISERNNKAATYVAEGEAEAKKIRTQTDYEISVAVSQAEAQAETLIAEGEAEYMRIMSAAYADAERSEFYNFLRSLDALKLAMEGSGEKTVILGSDSPISEIFNNVE